MRTRKSSAPLHKTFGLRTRVRYSGGMKFKVSAKAAYSCSSFDGSPGKTHAKYVSCAGGGVLASGGGVLVWIRFS